MDPESDNPASARGVVAVTGASGFVGRHLVGHLRQHGWQVRAIVRAVSEPAFNPSVDIRVVDTGDVHALARALEGCAAVINVAGMAHTGSDDPQAYVDGNVALPLRIAEAASRSGVARLVHVSSAHARLAEEDFAATRAYGRSKLEAERKLAAFSENHDTPKIISLRPPVIHGPDATGNVALLDRLAARGVPLPFGAISTERSYLSIWNLCSAIETSLEAADSVWENVNGQAFELCDGPPIRVAEFYKALAAAHGRTVMCPPVPPSLLRLALRLAGRERMANGLLEPFVLSNDLFTDAFGWMPETKSDITGSSPKKAGIS